MADRIRIIGGSWRGRWLEVANVAGLRPSGDRVRETLFNWLQHEIAGSCCLDLFAGTGALGLEAASRGAAEVHLVERDASACANLESLSDQLSPASVSAAPGVKKPPSRFDNEAAIRVHCADAIALLGESPSDSGGLPAADLIFVDPPFASHLQHQVLLALEQNSWLKPQALVYVEMERGELASVLPENWTIHRESHAGRVTFGLVYQSS